MMTLLQNLQQYRVTSQYGNRKDPFGSGKTLFHTGIDLVGKEVNDPVENFVEGDIVYSGDTHPGTGLGGFGWVVLVKDRYGFIYMYAHLQKESLKVKVGNHVVVGQELGILGNTGQSTGKHLHFEVRTKSSPSWGWGYHTNPFERLEQICKDGWTYYNNLQRKDKCDEMHAAAVLIRKLIGKVEK